MVIELRGVQFLYVITCNLGLIKNKKKSKKYPKKNFGINQHKAYQIAWACWSSASVVFEKSMSADLFQFAQENSCDYYYILYNNYIFLFLSINLISTFCSQF